MHRNRAALDPIYCSVATVGIGQLADSKLTTGQPTPVDRTVNMQTMDKIISRKFRNAISLCHLYNPRDNFDHAKHAHWMPQAKCSACVCLCLDSARTLCHDTEGRRNSMLLQGLINVYTAIKRRRFLCILHGSPTPFACVVCARWPGPTTVCHSLVHYTITSHAFYHIRASAMT